MKRTFFLLAFSFIVGVVVGQSKEDLQRQQQELIKEIRNLNASLKNIRNSKSKSLANYNLIRRKISAREELIRSINKDLRLLDNNIYLNQLEINRLRRDLDTLKMEYAQSLVFAYKNRSNYDYLNFIFSAATFNDAIKRITYLKSYRQYREQQVDNILKTQQLITDKIATLNNSKQEKNVALQDQSKQLVSLEADRKEQNAEVNKLKSQESELASQIRKRENDRKKMQNAIAAIIRREIAEAKKRAEALARQKKAEEDARKKRLAEQRRQEQAQKPADVATNRGNTPEPATEKIEPVVESRPKTDRAYNDLETSDEGRANSINFETSRGRLPWPASGIITTRFGPYTIPGTQLRGKSDGLYFSVPVGAPVKAVADGVVSSVYDLGGEQAVTIRHGKYFTTYSHLSSVSVSQGQNVGPQTVVGRAAANENGEGELLFMVINDRSVFLNPEQWLRGR